MADYKICDEILQLTPELIREWDNLPDKQLYLVKKQSLFLYPKTDTPVKESTCASCDSFYGWSSYKWIYCIPEHRREKGIRSMRRRENNHG